MTQLAPRGHSSPPVAEDDWPTRLAAIVAAAQAERARRREVRGQLAAARTAGLAARHRTKLARLTQEDNVTVYLTPAGDRQVQPADLDRKQAQRLRRAARRSARTPKPPTPADPPRDAA